MLYLVRTMQLETLISNTITNSVEEDRLTAAVKELIPRQIEAVRALIKNVISTVLASNSISLIESMHLQVPYK